MAGLGRRTFAAGEVLTASNVMGYLQDQAVMNFAGTAARGSAIGTAVSEGMVSYLADTNQVEVYDGSDWKRIGPSNQILQIQQYSTSTQVFSSTTSFATTGLTGTITPIKSNSKILVIVNQNGLSKEQADTYGQIKLVRTISGTPTDVGFLVQQYARNAATSFNVVAGTGFTLLETLGTTNTITYSTEFARQTASGFVAVQYSSALSTLTLIEVSA